MDGHAGRIADVEGEPVSGFVNALGATDLAGEGEEPGECFGVTRFYLARVCDVLAGNDEGVDGGAGIDVADGEGAVVLGDPLDGDIARGHIAKEAVGHGPILAGGERAASAGAYNAAMQIKLTSVTVNDQAKALAFYTEVLGFVLKRDDPAGEYRAITVEARDNPGEIELMLEPNAHPASKAFQETLNKEGIPVAIFFVDDLDREYERLTGLGVQFLQEPARSEWGYQAVLDDTCGNYIGLFEG